MNAPIKPVVKKTGTRPLDLKNGRVDMSHGAGGRAMAQLISDLFLSSSTMICSTVNMMRRCLPCPRGGW